MATSNVLLSHLNDYLGEKILPQGQRDELIARQGPYFVRLKNKNPTEEVLEVISLINRVESYSYDHTHLYNLIKIFLKNEQSSNLLYNTLCNPSIDYLSKLLDTAKGYDRIYRDTKGSTGWLFSEVLDTCVAAVAVLLKGLFAVIALPIAFGVGAALSLKFEDATLLDPAVGYISWLVDSFDQMDRHAKNVGLEYSKLTYDKTTQSAQSVASTLNGFFSKKTAGDSEEIPSLSSSLSPVSS